MVLCLAAIKSFLRKMEEGKSSLLALLCCTMQSPDCAPGHCPHCDRHWPAQRTWSLLLLLLSPLGKVSVAPGIFSLFILENKSLPWDTALSEHVQRKVVGIKGTDLMGDTGRLIMQLRFCCGEMRLIHGD